MSCRSLPDCGTRTVRSRRLPSDPYSQRQYRVRKGCQVLRASHPNIRLVPKQYFFMACYLKSKSQCSQANGVQGTSNIWVIPRGLVDDKSQAEIELPALWSPEYCGQYIIHESAIRHLKCQASDKQSIGSFRVTACINLDWSDSDHPDMGWTTNTNLFYVTRQTLPGGVKAIIASERDSQNLQANTSNTAAPVQNPILRQNTKQEQERRNADARTKREQDKKREEERNLKEYQREQAELQQRSQRKVAA